MKEPKEIEAFLDGIVSWLSARDRDNYRGGKRLVIAWEGDLIWLRQETGNEPPLRGLLADLLHVFVKWLAFDNPVRGWLLDLADRLPARRR